MNDYDYTPSDRIRIHGEIRVVTDVSRLAGLPEGYCTVYRDTDGHWYRKTKARKNASGSIRYHFHRSEQEALDAGQRWAKRKAQERARGAKILN